MRNKAKVNLKSIYIYYFGFLQRKSNCRKGFVTLTNWPTWMKKETGNVLLFWFFVCFLFNSLYAFLQNI